MARAENWEEALLREMLSQRAKAAGPAWSAMTIGAALPVAPIALTAGVPDPKSLPVQELAAASQRVLETQGEDALRYGGVQGFPGLRQWLADSLGAREELALNPDNFTLTNGSAGGLANVCETFLDPGDVVIVEAPTYPGALRTIRSCQAGIASVPVDADGLIPEALSETLERLLRDGRQAKILYLIPNFQNPSGATLSLKRREQVVELAERHRMLVLEDDAYGDISFSGRRLPSLFSLSGGRNVLSLGTFSKTLATGLRLGWVLAREPYVRALAGMRFDAGTTPWVQRTVAEYATAGLLERHVAEVVTIYRRKRDAMLSALEKHCRPFAEWNVPEGGFFLWMRLPETVDGDALERAAVEEGVVYVSGAAFFAGDDLSQEEARRRHLRLAYSLASEAEIQEACRRLGRAMERVAGAA